MTRLSLMCAFVGIMGAVLAAPACGRIEDDGFRGGVPRRETVQLAVPGGGATDTTGTGTSALLGEKADTWRTTRLITAVVNGGTGAVLTLVKTIIDYPASSVSGDTAVWGPHTEPLSPNTWRLTVTRLTANKFQWLLEARAKRDPDTAFLTIMSGTHTATVGPDGKPVEGYGSGDFVVDWDASQKLPEHDKNLGRATFSYARPSLGETVTVGVDFRGIQDDKTGEIFDAVYRYNATPGAGGDLQYAADQDNFPGPGPTGTAKEHFTLHSRWLETGAGRCDLHSAGGDLAPIVGTASECWTADFDSSYRNLSYDPTPAANWGAEADCSFAPAEYSSL